MRLIDADALMEALPETSADIFENCRNCKMLDKDDVVSIIEAAPTIEAEPVKHGQWYKPEGWPKKTYRRKCTLCQGVAYFCGGGDYLYCPNCGARMEADHEID